MITLARGVGLHNITSLYMDAQFEVPRSLRNVDFYAKLTKADIEPWNQGRFTRLGAMEKLPQTCFSLGRSFFFLYTRDTWAL